MLDARQLGLKLIANVTFGYTSAHFSGRMPCVEVSHSLICWILCKQSNFDRGGVKINAIYSLFPVKRAHALCFFFFDN